MLRSKRTNKGHRDVTKVVRHKSVNWGKWLHQSYYSYNRDWDSAGSTNVVRLGIAYLKVLIGKFVSRFLGDEAGMQAAN
jgi:hypothetical protein